MLIFGRFDNSRSCAPCSINSCKEIEMPKSFQVCDSQLRCTSESPRELLKNTNAQVPPPESQLSLVWQAAWALECFLINWVTLIHKILHISSVQLNKPSSACCIVLDTRVFKTLLSDFNVQPGLRKTKVRDNLEQCSSLLLYIRIPWRAF